MKSPPQFPRERAREPRGGDAQAPSAASADERTMRILLVEDDRATAAAIDLILRAEGFACGSIISSVFCRWRRQQSGDDRYPLHNILLMP